MAKKSTSIIRKLDNLKKIDENLGYYREPKNYDIPKRIPMNIKGEMALEEEERTGKIDFQNPDIIDTSSDDSLRWGNMQSEPCACAEVNGEVREFFAAFSKLDRGEKFLGKPCISSCITGLYSKQGNDFHMIPVEKRIWVTERWFNYFSPIFSAGMFFIMEKWLGSDALKGRIEPNEISYEVYNRFLQENQPVRPLPCALSLEGFMAVDPCAYAIVDDKIEVFFMAFSKTKGEAEDFRYKFEGVYSENGLNIMCIPENNRAWLPTDFLLTTSRSRGYILRSRRRDEGINNRIYFNKQTLENESVAAADCNTEKFQDKIDGNKQRLPRLRLKNAPELLVELAQEKLEEFKKKKEEFNIQEYNKIFNHIYCQSIWTDAIDEVKNDSEFFVDEDIRRIYAAEKKDEDIHGAQLRLDDPEFFHELDERIKEIRSNMEH